MTIRTAEIRRLEEVAIRDYGIPSLLLMENAGRGVGEAIRREYPPCNVLLMIGKGNNGGDGLVVARHLANHGYQPRVMLLEDPGRLKKDPLLNFGILRKMAVPVTLPTDALGEEEMRRHCLGAGLVVDAIFGVGISAPVRGVFEKAIRAIRESAKPVISIDIPSGLDADTGQIHGIAVKATATVTLALPKPGLYAGEGPAYAGKIEVVDIGIPRELLLPFLNA